MAKISNKSISLKIKYLVHQQRSSSQKTRVLKMKDRPIILLKTHVEKMSVLCLAIMLMKNKVVIIV
jgi:hypothetical protein